VPQTKFDVADRLRPDWRATEAVLAPISPGNCTILGVSRCFVAIGSTAVAGIARVPKEMAGACPESRNDQVCYADGRSTSFRSKVTAFRVASRRPLVSVAADLDPSRLIGFATLYKKSSELL